MKTLVIHPDDRSTDVLKLVYKNISPTIITNNCSLDEIEQLISEHDRIIMLGHGSPGGLFSIGLFPDTSGFVINNNTAKLLVNKQNNIYIWCHASDYVKRNNLKGFASGMFISEVYEARFCGVTTTQEEINKSCDLFSNLVGDNIHKPTKEFFEIVYRGYGELASCSKVAEYNHERLTYFI